MTMWRKLKYTKCVRNKNVDSESTSDPTERGLPPATPTGAVAGDLFYEPGPTMSRLPTTGRRLQ